MGMCEPIRRFYRVLQILTGCMLSLALCAQEPARYHSAEILHELNKFNVLGNVLYLAAHPDDENTRLITYMANEALMNTAYLSLTRGDGGQNLIGPEIQESLGVIRTQELLAARRLDGGRQFFSRAYDFGYSKTSDETMEIWEREKVLADAVWVIRKFRPDVIITRFPPEKYNYQTHGHHSASAIIAEEAFQMAGDPAKFPEQLAWVEPWKPNALYWNTSTWFYRRQGTVMDTTDKVIVDVGTYNPLLGYSLQEIAAESRSQHKSQGFGAGKTRGSQKEYLEYVMGDQKDNGNLFEGINTTWTRIKGGTAIQRQMAAVLERFDPEQPEAIVPQLIAIYKDVSALNDPYWSTLKKEHLKEIIRACLGLYMEASCNDFAASPGDAIEVTVEAVNRSDNSVQLKNVDMPAVRRDTTLSLDLPNNVSRQFTLTVKLPPDVPVSQPYWLKNERSKGMFDVVQQDLIGMAENNAALQATFTVLVEGEQLDFVVPAIFKRTDPVDGEQYRPFVICPPVTMNFDEGVYIFSENRPQMVTIRVRAGRDDLSGVLRLNLPGKWRASPDTKQVDLKLKGATETYTFQVFPPAEQHSGRAAATFTIGEDTYSQSLVEIDYPHIPIQMIFPEAEAKMVKINVQRKGQHIGYIDGAGDQIPESLKQIGYTVSEIDPSEIGTTNLNRFDAIVTGIRAFNTVDELKFQNHKLLDYVKSGGTLVIQYNTSHRLVTEDIGPYPIKLSRDRVTVEEAEVRFLSPEHPILNAPNKITSEDFDGWVQERGLYFPGEWDERYTPILSSNDPGEPPRDGGLLVAKYGEGHYIYSGYSWFRELPAGVPGAYRLFTNLISYGN